MPKYVRCGHYLVEPICPCMECESIACRGCMDVPKDAPYTVDTDRLCDLARRYCERGRTGADGEVYVEGESR